MFAKNLKRIRKLRGLTRKELAEKVGVTVKAIGHWETGIRKPTFDNLFTLTKVLNVSANELLK